MLTRGIFIIVSLPFNKPLTDAEQFVGVCG